MNALKIVFHIESKAVYNRATVFLIIQYGHGSIIVAVFCKQYMNLL
jgi:hypothetical protein